MLRDRLDSRHSAQPPENLAHNTLRSLICNNARNHLNIINNKVMSDPLNAPDGEAVFRITREDVVMGRGGSSQNHSGNVTYRKLVHHNKVRLVSYAFNNRHCHCVLITAGYLCTVSYIISWTCDALIVFFTPQ